MKYQNEMLNHIKILRNKPHQGGERLIFLEISNINKRN